MLHVAQMNLLEQGTQEREKAQIERELVEAQRRSDVLLYRLLSERGFIPAAWVNRDTGEALISRK